MGNPSSAEVEQWHATLRGFRFRRATGGHANDGDLFFGEIRFSGEAELISLFERLGRPLVALPPDASGPIVGQPRTHDQVKPPRKPIAAYPHLEAPAGTTLFDVPVYVAVDRDHVSLSLSGADGDVYVAGARDFQNARKLEAALTRAGVEMVSPSGDE